MIPFNIPPHIGDEETAISEAIQSNTLSGNGPFNRQCATTLAKQLNCDRVLMTPSCTAALEMAALLTEVTMGDEVIMPSYTFVSTANAFALRGAMIRFVDISPETMNINPVEIEKAINEQTKGIVIVHYAGVACDMEVIMTLAQQYGLWVVEDAAQCIGSHYKGQALGTFGQFGTLSFHDTKNITSGEGGALLINDRAAIERAEIIQEKGTNRKQFKNGLVDKYTWRDLGSSYLLSELNAAYLSVQLKHIEAINKNRLQTWCHYYHELADERHIQLPVIPEGAQHNAHMFYIKVSDEDERLDLLHDLAKHGITAVSHYTPLHRSQAGQQFGLFNENDRYTTIESNRLIRLPLYYGMKEEDVHHVVQTISHYYHT